MIPTGDTADADHERHDEQNRARQRHQRQHRQRDRERTGGMTTGKGVRAVAGVTHPEETAATNDALDAFWLFLTR